VNPEHLCVLPWKKHKELHRAFCKHGHALTPDNVYTRRGGRPECKICTRRRSNESYYRRKNAKM
jgi:transposase-like protein